MSIPPDAPRAADALAGLGATVKKHAFAWLLVRGLLAVLLGVLMFVAPGLSGSAIALFIAVCIGAWLVVDGVASIMLGVKAKGAGAPRWGWSVVVGVVSIIAAVLVFAFPVSIAAFLGLMVLWIMALGLVVRGIAELMERHLGGWGIALGILDILFGVWLVVLILSNPASLLVSVVWVAGIYGVVFGIATVAAAFKVRNA